MISGIDFPLGWCIINPCTVVVDEFQGLICGTTGLLVKINETIH